ncbi:MAG: hypothetical protein ACOC2X_01155 [Bacillota bacterium]
MTIEIPGKLFISGEYAVLHGAHAVLAPVRRTMRFECVPASRDTFASSKYGTLDLEKELDVPKPVTQAYRIALDYLNLQNIPRKHFLLSVRSALDHEGMKLGLGSSGVLTVGIIRSIVAFHGVRLENDKLYKLSVLSQRHSAPYASFGDIAVAVHGAWILYRRFDPVWLKRHAHFSLDWLLKHPWPKLRITPFKPGPLKAFAINSRHPASSKALVEAFNERFDTGKHASLIDTMDQLSLTLYNELEGRLPCTHTISALNHAYDRLIEAASLDLKPAPLEALMTTIEAFGGVAKISGAGGGDCVLAFFDHPATYKKAWHHFTLSEYPCIHLRRPL